MPGDKFPEALVSLIENNSPHLIDTFERAGNGSYYRKKNYVDTVDETKNVVEAPKEVKVEKKEVKKDEKPKKKK